MKTNKIQKCVQLAAAAAAKSLQSWPTLCDPIDGSPPGSPVPGILQARTLEWVAISFSNVWKWKVKVKSLSRARLLGSLQPARLFHPWDFPGKSTGVGCHCLLQGIFPTQALNSCLLYWKVDSLPLTAMKKHGTSICGLLTREQQFLKILFKLGIYFNCSWN